MRAGNDVQLGRVLACDVHDLVGSQRVGEGHDEHGCAPQPGSLQRQRELNEHFSVAQLQRELEGKRLEQSRRVLQQRQALLHERLRDAATAAERIELGPVLTGLARDISRVDEALHQLRTRDTRQATPHA